MAATALNRTLKALTRKLDGNICEVRSIVTILEFMLTDDDTDTEPDPREQPGREALSESCLADGYPRPAAGAGNPPAPSLQASLSPEFEPLLAEPDGNDGAGTLNRANGATSPTSHTRASPSGSPNRRTPTRERVRVRLRKLSTGSDGADRLMRVPAEGEGLLALPREIHIRIFEFLTMFDAIKVGWLCPSHLPSEPGKRGHWWRSLYFSLRLLCSSLDCCAHPSPGPQGLQTAPGTHRRRQSAVDGA